MSSRPFRLRVGDIFQHNSSKHTIKWRGRNPAFCCCDGFAWEGLPKIALGFCSTSGKSCFWTTLWLFSPPRKCPCWACYKGLAFRPILSVFFHSWIVFKFGQELVLNNTMAVFATSNMSIYGSLHGVSIPSNTLCFFHSWIVFKKCLKLFFNNSPSVFGRISIQCLRNHMKTFVFLRFLTDLQAMPQCAPLLHPWTLADGLCSNRVLSQTVYVVSAACSRRFL